MRPFAARLAGSRGWAPCRPADGAPDTTRCDAVVPARALVEAARHAGGRRGAGASMHDAAWASAVVDLVSGPTRREPLDRSIASLATVVAADSTNAAARNDLAVAHLVAASARGDAMHLVQALDAIELAAAADSTSDEIAFNRALILERLRLVAEARAAWEAFGRRDRTGEWAEEARRRLAALAARSTPPSKAPNDSADAEWRRAVATDPQGVRERVIDSLLPAWASATLAGDSSGAARAQRAATVIGTLLAHRSGDSSALHVARTAMGARAVAVGVADYARGARDYRRGDFVRSAPVLTRAAAALRRTGAAPAAGWGELLVAAIDIYRGDYDAAEARYARLRDEAAARHDLALGARAQWGLALSLSRRGRTVDAADRYESAEAQFARAGERRNRAMMQSQHADALVLLGRESDALRAKIDALATLADGEPRLRHELLLDLGRQLGDAGLSAAGIAALRESVRGAANAIRPKDRPEALIRLGRAEATIGRAADARRHLREARAALAAVGDTLMRDRLAMEEASAGAALAADTPTVAVQRLSDVEAYYARQRIAVSRGANLARRAHAWLRLGDTTRARADLATAAAIVETQTANVADPVAAREVVAARHDVYRGLIALSAATNDTAAALAYAARARGAVERLPRRDRSEVALVYAVLPDATILWIASDGGTRMRRAAIGAAALRDRIERFTAAIRRDDAEVVRVESRALYDVLVAPAADDVRRARALVIEADGVLGRLPFAALRDTAGRYLVQSVALRNAVSQRSGAIVRDRGLATALLVADPAFDPTQFPALERLRGAVREVADVGATYPRKIVLGGRDATKRALLDALPTAALVHFAGHARLVERSPALSHLVLAPPSTGAGLAASVLTAAEIARLDLRRLRLVVLSACGTTQERSRRDDGESGLSEAFLDAGAHAVISSLWEADDAGTAALMAALHRELAGGIAPAEALRRAQVRLLEGDATFRAPRMWSAFRYEGG